MSLLSAALAKARKEPVMRYAPIVRAVLMLAEPEKQRMRDKFDLYYLMAKEGITIKKCVAMYELESRQLCQSGPCL